MEIMQCLENVEKLGGFGCEVGFCERGEAKGEGVAFGRAFGVNKELIGVEESRMHGCKRGDHTIFGHGEIERCILVCECV